MSVLRSDLVSFHVTTMSVIETIHPLDVRKHGLVCHRRLHGYVSSLGKEITTSNSSFASTKDDHVSDGLGGSVPRRRSFQTGAVGTMVTYEIFV
ncbi:hypothetical protein CEXT_573891 [Caerostris extrusa]|uniref:Uncharacterized protein n=1 Tax=Caerostris extrusa TaxID=172846 RepID=A0AAV4TD49_CAEEX|nr:hypothetical protein CEXT_573891 [Caerostris extrusa]